MGSFKPAGWPAVVFQPVRLVIGKDLAQKIAEVVETGHLPLLDEIERRVPPGLARLLGVPGLGPKRVRALYETLKVDARSGSRKSG